MSETRMDKARARVAKGVVWLDENKPGWRTYVTVGRLEMDSCETCVLGQVFADPREVIPGFDLAMEYLAESDDVELNAAGYSEQWAYEYGFDGTINYAKPGRSHYHELQEVWEEELAK